MSYRVFKKTFLTLISFYQSYITHLKISSCRYHPTCSAYAKLEFKHNNLFTAIINSTLRILRCNQLFAGGIDHPVISKKLPLQCMNNKKKDIKFWFIKKSKNRYYVIKSFKEYTK